MAMTPDMQSPATSTASAEQASGSLADVLDVILDKGLVIDAFVRVSLVGIEILTVDARIVVASVETYMHFAREAHRLQMGGGQGSAKQGLGGMMGHLAEGGAHNISRGALQGAGEGLREGLFPHRQESGDRRGVVQRAVGAIRDAVTTHNDQEEEGAPAADEGASRQDSGAPGPARRAVSAVRDAIGSEQSEEGESRGGASEEDERAPARRSRQSTPRSTRRQQGQGQPQSEQASGQSRRRQSRAEAPRHSAEADQGTDGPEPRRGGSGESPPQGRQARAPRRTPPSSRRAPSREPRD